MQNLSCENELDLHETKKHFYINGLAVGLAFKQRLWVTRKWPNLGKIDQCVTKSDQHQFSPNNVNTYYSREKVMRVNKIINQRKML